MKSKVLGRAEKVIHRRGDGQRMSIPLWHDGGVILKKLIVFELRVDGGKRIRLRLTTARRAIERSPAVSQPLLQAEVSAPRLGDGSCRCRKRSRLGRRCSADLGELRICNVFKLFIDSDLCIFARNSAWKTGYWIQDSGCGRKGNGWVESIDVLGGDC